MGGHLFDHPCINCVAELNFRHDACIYILMIFVLIQCTGVLVIYYNNTFSLVSLSNACLHGNQLFAIARIDFDGPNDR